MNRVDQETSKRETRGPYTSSIHQLASKHAFRHRRLRTPHPRPDLPRGERPRKLHTHPRDDHHCCSILAIGGTEMKGARSCRMRRLSYQSDKILPCKLARRQGETLWQLPLRGLRPDGLPLGYESGGPNRRGYNDVSENTRRPLQKAHMLASTCNV